jgi:hypothetical protein
MLSISPSAGSTGAPFFLSFFLSFSSITNPRGYLKFFVEDHQTKFVWTGRSAVRNVIFGRHSTVSTPFAALTIAPPMCTVEYSAAAHNPPTTRSIFWRAVSLLYYYVSSWEDIMKIDSWTALLTLIQIETVIIIKDIDSRCRLLPHNEDVVRERKELHVSSNFWC